MDTAKIPVGVWAVVQRINRILAKENKLFMESLDAKSKLSWGDWYIKDAVTNTVITCHCGIEGVAREVGALKPNETVS